MDDQFYVLHFKLIHVLMCIEIQYIEKVLPLMEILEVPNAPNYQVGLINLHEKAVPVIDLALLLGMNRKSYYTIDYPIILCRGNEGRLGLIVDGVCDLAEYDRNKLQMLEEMKRATSPYLGALTLDQEVSLLINIKKIITFYFSNQNLHLSVLEESVV